MPKAVIYAPSSHRGLRIKDFHVEQGLQQVLQVIKHNRKQTTLGKLMAVTIQAYQIAAGIALPILEDTQPLPWLPSHWVSNL